MVSPHTPSHLALRSGGGVTLRLFAALRVPVEPAAIIADVADALASRTEGARPVDQRHLHVTWAFLGDVAEEVVPAVASAFEAAAFDVPGPTQCAVTRVVPMAERRVLALEVELDLLATLDAARDRFLDAVAPYAPDLDERGWRPHVSIVRSTDGRPLPADLFGGSYPAPAARWVVPELGLFASLPGPSGHQHRALHAVPFGVPVSPS
ncbi:MAG: 2,3-cyclic phosphodiesterase [Thermoleophilia bacterium]|nr:2,3-cyclic phosphodiesterase [Thermoleophilia bacterium]